jgi:hypothetical protein
MVEGYFLKETLSKVDLVSDIVRFFETVQSELYTYLSTIETCFKTQNFWVEIMYAGPIYENQIETFSVV